MAGNYNPQSIILYHADDKLLVSSQLAGHSSSHLQSVLHFKFSFFALAVGMTSLLAATRDQLIACLRYFIKCGPMWFM